MWGACNPEFEELRVVEKVKDMETLKNYYYYYNTLELSYVYLNRNKAFVLQKVIFFLKRTFMNIER